MKKQGQDWNPTSAEVLRDQVNAYDQMRQRCPVARSELLGWSLFRHADVAAALADPETFSNVVSTHRSVPNGMDPPEHTAYRKAIETYFAPESIRGFEPLCRRFAKDLLERICTGIEFDFMDAFATPFALKCQCAFLGWPEELVEPVWEWTRRNRDAILSADRLALAELSSEFESCIGRLLDSRRGDDNVAVDDVTTALMNVKVNGQPLTDEELTSVFRNWTVGEIGSMAAALGILVKHLADSPTLQQRLREDPKMIPAAIEEMLRVEGPLVSNRRRVTRDVTMGGRRIAAGDRVTLMWISANRDECVFDEPSALREERDQTPNLVWGAGIHVCPGAPLARLEMRVAVEVLLSSSNRIVVGRASPARLVYPENGWGTLPLRLA